MAQRDYTYIRSGASQGYIASQVPGTGTVYAAVPPVYQRITWDETYKADLDYAMSQQGWTYAYEGQPSVAKTIAQIQSTVRTVDASAIVPADGWVTVDTRTLATRGGSAMGVQITAVGNTNGSSIAQARILINGGAYTNTVIGADQYDLHDADWGHAAFHHPVALADTSPAETTYTVSMQLSVTGIGSTVTARKGCVITLVEYR